jgi:hypothetical protein
MGVGIMRDETLKRRDLNSSHTLGCVGRNNSERGSGFSGHGGNVRSVVVYYESIKREVQIKSI